MKLLLNNRLRAAWLIWLAPSFAPVAYAQAPPGWGWVNTLGTYVPNTTSANNVAGLGRDAAGNLYLLGTYVGAPVLSGVPTTSQGDDDIFLAKYSPAGALLWLHTLQSSGSDRASALYVEPSGRCTLAGSYGGRTGGNLFFGNFNSTTTLPGAAVFGLATTGGYYGELPFVAAVDATGALLWADNTSPTYGLTFNALHRDSGGNCYVSANTRPQSLLTVNGQNYPAIGTYDAVLIKYSILGQATWARRVGASGGFTESESVKTDAVAAVYWTINHNRNVVIDGRAISFVSAANPVTQGSNSLVKINANNSVVWAKNSLLKSGSNNAQGAVLAIDQVTNTMYLSAGSYAGTVTDKNGALPLAIPTGNFGTCIAKCDTSGSIQWIRPFAYASVVNGGAGWAAVELLNFFPDAVGYTALTNTAHAARTVFPTDNTFDLSKNAMPCITRFTYASNQFEWIRTGGVASVYGTSSPSSHAIASVIDATGNVFVAGTFDGTAQFGTTTITSASSGQPEIFLAKLDQTIITATKSPTQGRAWSVYPNPATGTVQLAGLPVTALVRVYDAQGRLVHTLLPEGTLDAPRTISGLAPGLYLLQVGNTAEAYRSQRLVVQ